MVEYSLDGYIFKAPSRLKSKKYDVYNNGRYIVSFGGLGYSQYYDKIGHYASLDNLSVKRRELYYRRHNMAPKFESADYFAKTYLW